MTSKQTILRSILDDPSNNLSQSSIDLLEAMIESMNIDTIRATKEWYAKRKNIKVAEFDHFDGHICRAISLYLEDNK